MTRRSIQNRRGTSGARLRLAGGVGCLLVAGLPFATASASPDEGAQLQSFSLQADASALRVRQGTQQTEAVLPQTLAQLRNGPVGFGQSASVWPGTIAGNIGSLLILAADAPKQAAVLDSPVRAEARTGTGPSEVTNQDYPGTTMRASATAEQVTADTTLAATATLPAGTVGASTAASRSAVRGARGAVAEASSSVRDISLLAGQVTVASVASTARATTDGTKTTVDGHTVVTDLRVAGQRVSVDSDGITVLGQSGPDTAPAVAAVNEVVKAAKLVIVVSDPVGTQDGGQASFTSGNLVIAFTQSSGAVLSLVLGGANVTVAALPEGPTFGLPVPPPPLGQAAVVAAAGPAPFDIAAGVHLAAPPLLAAAPAPAAPIPLTVGLPAIQNASFTLTGPLSVAWLALAVLGSLLVGSALRRMPDAMVATGVGFPSCPMQERP